MPELIRLNIPFIVVLLLAALAFGIVYFFYRQTNPQIQPFWKWILIALRTAVLFLIFLLFGAPVVHLIYFQEQYPSIAIFVDNSQSMNIKENQIDRWQKVKQITYILKNELPKTDRIHWYTFNSRVSPLLRIDSLSPSQGGTNFIPVLTHIQKENPDYAFIISDGVITEGGLPGELSSATRTKIYCIPVGRVHSESDVFVQDVRFSPIAYKGQAQTITAIIGSTHWPQKQTALVQLIGNRRVLAQKTVTIVPGSGLMQVGLTYVPMRKGLQNLKLKISGLKDDANRDNNIMRFVQQILKSRIHVALLASAPNYDIKFLHFLLKQNSRFSVTWFVEDNRGRFLQKSNLRGLDSSDVLFLINYPGPRSSNELLQRLQTLWHKRHPSLALMINKEMNWQTLERVIPDLPCKPVWGSGKEKQVTAIPDQNAAANSFVRLFAEQHLNQTFWNRIPPIENYFQQFEFSKTHTTLLFAAYGGKIFPLVFTQELPVYKLLVLNGNGFWQWHFLMQSEAQISDGYSIFMNKLINWLAYKQVFKPVRIITTQKSGHIGQTFEMTVRLVDARFKPVQNGSVILKAQLGQQHFDLGLNEISPGTFKAQFVPPTAGTYKLQAIGFQQDQILGKDSLQIAVVPVDKELVHLSPDTLFLQRLSRNSEGQIIHAKQLGKFLRNHIVKPKKVLEERSIALWYHPVLLILLILLISFEWALRKKLNLV